MVGVFLRHQFILQTSRFRVWPFNCLILAACGDGTLLLWQFIAVVASSAWACFWTVVIFKVTSKLTPIRASEHGELIGLDLDGHGEMLVCCFVPTSEGEGGGGWGGRVDGGMIRLFFSCWWERTPSCPLSIGRLARVHNNDSSVSLTRLHRAVLIDNSSQQSLNDLTQPLIAAAQSPL